VTKGWSVVYKVQEDPCLRRSYFFLIADVALMALGFTSARSEPDHHSVNISDGHRHPATDCSDLRNRFDDRDAVCVPKNAR